MVTEHVTQLGQYVGDVTTLHSFLREQNEKQSAEIEKIIIEKFNMKTR